MHNYILSLSTVKEIAEQLHRATPLSMSYESILLSLLPIYGHAKLTLEDIGYLLNVTKQRIDQLMITASTKIYRQRYRIPSGMRVGFREYLADQHLPITQIEYHTQG